MDLNFTPKQLAFRDEVRQWLAENLPPQYAEKSRQGRVLTKDETEHWQSLLNAKGWLAPHWPVEHGGTGWGPVELYIFGEEMALAGAQPAVPFGFKMLAPVLFKFGTDAQKAKWLPRMLSGEDWWCQGYSEPGSGSDLASLNTSAVLDGDHFVVNGQKTWTSLGQHANMIFVLVRTSNQGKPQEGISFILVDMNTPGVEVRPIKLVDGSHEVNEVWFTDVKVPVENLVGEINSGWTCAKYLLGYERANTGNAGRQKRQLAELKTIAREQYRNGKPLIEDPLFAARLARAEIRLMDFETTCLRVLSAVAGGDMPMAEASIIKVMGSELLQEFDTLKRKAVGRYAVPFEPGILEKGTNAELPGPAYAAAASAAYHNDRKVSIYAGSNEIQKNIVSKIAGL